MDGYTRDAQAPPAATRVTDLVVMRTSTCTRSTRR